MRSGTGWSFVDERMMIEAVVWRLRNEARWRAVPDEFGPWYRATQLHYRWSKMGIWARRFALLRDRGRPEFAEVFLDGTIVRAHQKAAGSKGGAMPKHSAARAQRRTGVAAASAPRPV